MAPWQHWIDENKALPGQIIIEAKWALDRQFNNVNWSAPAAWYRGKADFTRIDGPVADGIDWKTGAHQGRRDAAAADGAVGLRTFP